MFYLKMCNQRSVPLGCRELLFWLVFFSRSSLSFSSPTRVSFQDLSYFLGSSAFIIYAFEEGRYSAEVGGCGSLLALPVCLFFFSFSLTKPKILSIFGQFGSRSSSKRLFILDMRASGGELHSKPRKVVICWNEVLMEPVIGNKSRFGNLITKVLLREMQ